MRGIDLNMDTVGDDLAFLLELMELVLGVLGEAELDGRDDLLATGILEHGSSEGLLSVHNVISLNSD